MFDINISEKILQQCRNDKTNLGHRGHGDGDDRKQFIGKVGETTLLEALGFKRYINTGYDHGIDFIEAGIAYDIKTMGRMVYPRPEYVNNFLDCQKNLDAQVFIFCSFNQRANKLTVCGWINKQEFFKVATLYHVGETRYNESKSFDLTEDNWEILNRNLHEANDLQTLKSLICDGNT